VPVQYATWDRHYIRTADILFGYMEEDNPSGYGFATEIGFAKGLSETLVLVDEKSRIDEHYREYFAIVREMPDVVLDSLDEGITLLRKFARDASIQSQP